MIAVIFDWDGTLVNSMPAFLEAWTVFCVRHFDIEPGIARNFMLDNLGRPLTVNILELAAISDREMSTEELSELAVRWAETCFRMLKSAPMFADVPGALSKLKDSGYDLSVSSGWDEVPLHRDVKARGVNRCFTFILGTRDGGFHKGEPHFDFISKALRVKPTDMVFVGDGPYDMKVGKDYGCLTVGRVDQVDPEKLLSSGADSVIEDLHSLPRVIEERIVPRRR